MKKVHFLSGFGNLYKKELIDWWAGFHWVLRVLLWVIVLNGMMAFVLFMLEPLAIKMGQQIEPGFDPVSAALSVMFQIGTTVFAIAAVISSQDLIFSERVNGQTEWILSKPISRSAYVLAKFVANFVSFLLVNIMIPALIGYFLISFYRNVLFPIESFLTALLGLIIHSFFYYSFSILLGVTSEKRNSILGVSMGFLFAGVFVVFVAGNAVAFTPWIFSNILTPISMNMDLPFSILVPFLATASFGCLFLFFALYKFNMMDF